jgi:hypothetical protein
VATLPRWQSSNSYESKSPASAGDFQLAQQSICQKGEFNTMSEFSGKYKPVSAWGYFGLTLLYALPLIGFIFLLIHSFSDANINRRNFARSHWCILLLLVFLFLIGIGLAYAQGGAEAVQQILQQIAQQAQTAG